MRMGVSLEYKWVYEVILYESSGSCNQGGMKGQEGDPH
jgi:hypothetical protein